MRTLLSICCLSLVLVVGCGTDSDDTTTVAEGIEDNLPHASTTQPVPKTELPPTTAAPTTTTTAAPTTTVPPTTTTVPPTTTTAAPPPPPPTTVAVRSASPDCHPSYDPCVPNASDVDCAGGSGNGPAYTGQVSVIGPDVYDLDRDGDGIGCE